MSRSSFACPLLAWALLAVAPPLAGTTPPPAPPPSPASPALPAARDGQHDFDFEIGTWRTHLRRLPEPLTGSTTWVEYEGTSVVREIWGGRANLVELDVRGTAGRIEGLSLRLYNPQAGQWSLTYASSRAGTLTPPVTGSFATNGRGEFYGLETLEGRVVLVRFVITPLTADSWRFEQAFSADGGRSWELNWIATDTRVRQSRAEPVTSARSRGTS